MVTGNMHLVIRKASSAKQCLALLLLVFGTSGSRVQAQSMNYGALEQLFGEPVTTSVTGSPQRVSEVPATMDIITAEDIRRSGARDIPGVLRHVAGIDVLQWANDNADVAIRGYNQALSSRLLVLIDGRQVYADFYGYTPWTELPVELNGIRQIEIVKGPNSALFGFNAVGGVINIITYHPLHDDVDTLSVTGGTQDLVQGSLVTTTKLSDAVGIRLFVGGHSNDDFSSPQRPLDVGSRQGNKRKELNLKGVFQLTPKTDLAVELSHSDTQEPVEILTYQMFTDKYNVNSIQAVLSADTGLGLLEARLYGNSMGLRSRVLDVPVDFSNRLVVAQVQDVFKLGTRHTIRVAAEYRSNTVNTTPISGAHVFSEITSVSTMWDWKLMPNLSLTNAVRLDRMSLGRNGSLPPGYGLTNADWTRRSISEPSFNSGLVWTTNDLGTFRLTAARGVQMPSLAAFGAVVAGLAPGVPLYASGNPFTDPAVVMNYEVGWERLLPSVNTQLRISTFYETTKKVVSLLGGQILSAGLVSTSTDIGDSEAYGVELSLKGTLLENWRWGFSYTPQFITDHRRPGLPVSTTLTDFEHMNPKHVIKGNLGWSHGAWELDGYLQYQSDFYLVQATGSFGQGALVPISDYISVDGRVAYRFSNKVTLALSGQNLLNKEQQQTSAAAVERRVLATVSVDF